MAGARCRVPDGGVIALKRPERKRMPARPGAELSLHVLWWAQFQWLPGVLLDGSQLDVRQPVLLDEVGEALGDDLSAGHVPGEEHVLAMPTSRAKPWMVSTFVSRRQSHAMGECHSAKTTPADGSPPARVPCSCGCSYERQRKPEFTVFVPPSIRPKCLKLLENRFSPTQRGTG